MPEKLLEKIKQRRNEEIEIPDWVEDLSHEDRLEMMKSGLEGLVRDGGLSLDDIEFLQGIIKSMELQ